MKRDDKRLKSGSVVYWSRQYRDGKYASGQVRWRVPVRCSGCGEERVVSADRAHGSGFTGLCLICTNIRTGWARRTTEDEVLANGSVILWPRRFEDGRYPGGQVRWRVLVRCSECGEERVVNASRACRSGFTGLCLSCAGYEKIDISKETLVHFYHDEDLSLVEVSDRLGCSEATVLNRMEEYSIQRRPSACVPQTLVPEEVLRRWTSDLSYLAGMITTDGSLARGLNAVSFYSTDCQWIETYLELLRISVSVYETPLKSGKTFYTVQISDPDYRAFLEEIGLTPAKSTERTLGPLNIPDEFFRDFFRACIDGDGGLYARSQKGRSTLRLEVKLFSVCRSFLEWVRETVERLIGLEATGLYRGSGGSWKLEYYDSKARRLLEWIYYAPDLPCLERKRAVWEEYL